MKTHSSSHQDKSSPSVFPISPWAAHLHRHTRTFIAQRSQGSHMETSNVDVSIILIELHTVSCKRCNGSAGLCSFGCPRGMDVFLSLSLCGYFMSGLGGLGAGEPWGRCSEALSPVLNAPLSSILQVI